MINIMVSSLVTKHCKVLFKQGSIKRSGGGVSPIDTYFSIKTPSGKKMYVGEVGTPDGLYVGGAQQIVVIKNWGIKGAKIVERKPLK
ncbi:hypothetical protein C5E04_04165 [Pectobacterium parmentieri]|nr:hypothetical protein C5E04_04165 [Pectobacterium parmentieri]